MVNDPVRISSAFALPILLVMVGAWLSWAETWTRAEGELSRTADSAAEYSKRVFGSATLAGRLTNSLLAEATDQEIQADERHYHGLLAGIMPELPLANTITVSDGNGDLILMSTVYPVPEISVADREWVLALRADPESAPHVGPLSFGRVAGRPFFSVSVPRDAPDIEEGYEGLINVSLDPFAVARGLAYTTHEAADVLSIIRSDGAILSSTGSNWVDAPRVPDASPLRPAMIAGEDRGMYEGQSIGLREGLPLGRGLLIAFRRVGDLPVYVTVSRPNRAIMAPWFETLARLLVVGIPASLALGFLAVSEARRRSELQGSEAELRAAFENATTGNALVDAGSNRILKANTCLGQIAGRPPDALVGMRLDDLFGDGDTQGPAHLPGLADAMLLVRPDGGHRWVELSSAPVTQSGAEEPARLIATIHDVTERRQSEERQFVLAREVDHRAKNVLAIVQAIVRLVRDPAARSAVKDIEGRIQALARAHDLMSSDRWEGAGLRELLLEELGQFEKSGRIEIDGSTVKVRPSAVQPLTMALHELASNANRHGGLARAGGRVKVAWDDPASDRWALRWVETWDDVPETTDGSEGSGLAILRGSVDQLGGSMRWDRSDRGLVCTLEFPAERVVKALTEESRETSAA